MVCGPQLSADQGNVWSVANHNFTVSSYSTLNLTHSTCMIHDT